MTKVTIGKITDSCLGKMLDKEKNKGIPKPYLANINVRWGDFDTDSLSYMRFEENEDGRYGIKDGDLIVCEGGEPGRCAIWDGRIADMKIQKALHRVRAKSGYDIRYIYYWMLLAGKNNALEKYFTGSTIKHLPGDRLKEIELEIPNYKEQVAVADLLSCLDLKIRTNAILNDNLAQQAKLLYDYWFTQFDFPDENDKPYRSSGGQMVWNDRMKRNIPTGWQVVTFTNIATWESNSQPPKSEFRYEPQEGYVRFIQNRDYDSNAHKTYIPLTKNLSIVDRLDILMDKYGDAGAVRYGIEGAFNVALGKINVHNTSHREYIRSYLESDGIYTYLHNSCMASTRASLSESNLANLILVMPDAVTIAKYEAILNNIRKRILKNNDEIEKLVALRDWLLPLLMNGQATIVE